MSKSFTPGLKVLENTSIRKTRLLPLKGKVLISKGDKVKPETVVASTEIPGNVHMVNISNELNVAPEEIHNVVNVDIDSNVNEGDVIAGSSGLFGMFKSEVKSPVSGKISNISDVTGQMVISEHPIPINLSAYISGEVSEVLDGEGVSISSMGAMVQGIIGIGGERVGTIEVITSSSDAVIKESDIKEDMKGKIVIAGSYVDYKVFNKACNVGVSALISGGFDYKDLNKILGYNLGVAVTGNEDIKTTLIILEGFGKIPISNKAFNIFSKFNSMKASVNGSTQIRAGVLRPEIIIPHDSSKKENLFNENDLVIKKGSTVRIIRAPYFGSIGTVIDLPPDLVSLESGAIVRAATVKFDSGETFVIPRSNMEIILDK